MNTRTKYLREAYASLFGLFQNVLADVTVEDGGYAVFEDQLHGETAADHGAEAVLCFYPAGIAVKS